MGWARGRRPMRDPLHMEVTTYGCWLSPLTRFAAPHCRGPSSDAASWRGAITLIRFLDRIVKGRPTSPRRVPSTMIAPRRLPRSQLISPPRPGSVERLACRICRDQVKRKNVAGRLVAAARQGRSPNLCRFRDLPKGFIPRNRLRHKLAQKSLTQRPTQPRTVPAGTLWLGRPRVDPPRKDSGMTPMTGLPAGALAPCLFATLVLCFVSACAARLSVGSRCQRLFQSLFTGCLLLVGVLTATSVTISPNLWVLPAATFALMVLMATCDFGRSRRVAAW